MNTIPLPVSDHGEGDRRKREAFSLLHARRAVFARRGRRAMLSRLLNAGHWLAVHRTA